MMNSRLLSIAAKSVRTWPRCGQSRAMLDDIAKGIVFLASDDAGFMTGAGLVIDGGSTAQ